MRVGAAVKPLPFISHAKLAVVLGATTVLLLAADLRAERVGYRFQGNLIQSGSPGNYTLFSTSVPKTSPIAGTFSYDTTAPCMDCDPSDGVRTYHQLIQGGYTLNINNGAIQLSANDYTITIANDSGSSPVDSFIVDYTYDSTVMPPVTPDPIQKNGTAFTGTKAQVYLQLDWPAETFTDLDEPKLTSDRPITPGASVCSFCADVESSSTPRFFSVTLPLTAISPLPGDYNVNGKFDLGDYTEWRKAFGESQPQYLYADGNDNGVVDIADYIVWRKAGVASGTGSVLGAIVPEPASLMLTAAGFAIVAACRLRLRHRPSSIGENRPWHSI
jgi:hypothetical protein